MPQSNSIRILCVEDDSDTCELLSVVFKPLGYETFTVNTIMEAWEQYRFGQFSLIILDDRFDEGSGTGFCRAVREIDQRTPIVMFSASANPLEIEAAMAAGATEFVAKPYWEALVEATTRLIANK